MTRLFGVVPAAGGGTRFGAGTPKQYARLDGVPLLARTLGRLLAGLSFETVLVAIARDDAWYEHAIGPRAGVEAVRCGGLTRGETVRNALRALAGRAEDGDWVLVHDAARPCVPRAALLRLVERLWDDEVGGLLAIPVADTLKRADTFAGRAAEAARVVATEDRAALWQAQTPQMFRYRVLVQALADEEALGVTDEAQAVERLGMRPRLVPGSPANLKVTWPEDLALAAAILAAEVHEGEER
ncbi:MAG: 2-C-methyl-D-erythritol 4-phosphate cytidylyltransferase [Betaproteobacteria bacterium]|nr:2-C-methyl-D-erythritol 4-phosphate cytidylyltransferase [Betaproteobacteria bacterium]